MLWARTLFFLLLWSVIPGTIMVISCLYMCICSKFVFIGDDGHMRIFCCGKAVTGSTPSPPPVHCFCFPVDNVWSF